jgi:hypothetical protein
MAMFKRSTDHAGKLLVKVVAIGYAHHYAVQLSEDEELSWMLGDDGRGRFAIQPVTCLASRSSVTCSRRS